MYRREPPDASGNEEELRLWRHVFGGERGLLHIFVGTRGREKLLETRPANYNYPNAAQDAAEWALFRSAQGWEVYFCAHLLTGPKRTKKNAGAVRALWGELDGAELPNSDLKPTAVVESSPGHYHVYWRLTDPIPPETAESLNKRLAAKVGADPSGFDLSQLLRVPGTVNYKYPEKPVVRLAELDASREYVPGDLEKRIPAPDKPTRTTTKDASGEPPVRLGPYYMKRWRGEVVERTENGEVDRSRALLEIAKALARSGASVRVIAEALRERDKALGFEKATNRSDGGAKWYRDTAQSAYNSVEQQEPADEPPDDPEPYKPYKPFSKENPDAQSFPVDALPEGCRQLVREASETIGCPPDFVAAPILAALGSAIGRSYVVQVVEGWTEAPALWIATVGHPGSRRTPPAREAKRPIVGRQTQLRQKYRDELREYENDEDREEEPVERVCYVDDTTTEALIATLDENPRGVIQFKDELLGLIRGLDQYKGGRGSDRQFYLSAWSGESYSYRRKGAKERALLPSPFLSVVGSIQTDLLHEIAEGREDGLADRFLFVYPDRVRSRLSKKKGISESARKSYAALYMRLSDLDTNGEDEYGNMMPRVVKPTPKAEELLHDLINEMREETWLPGFPTRLGWVWSKLEGYLARLTLILALCRIATLRAVGHDVAQRVETEDVMKASTILAYFQSHIRRVFTRLYEFKPEDRLVEDIARFLSTRGGSWSEGTATDFYNELVSDYKPERPDELSKFIKKRAKESGEFSYETRLRSAKKEDGSPTTTQLVEIRVH